MNMDMVEYWDKLFKMGWIQIGLVMVGGDLNFTLVDLEVWRLISYVDYLSGYFIKKLEDDGC
jgi:hypothetical protein